MRRKTMFLLVAVLSLCLLVSLTAAAFAQGEHSPQANAVQGQQSGIKERPVSDRQQLKEQHRGYNPPGVGPGNPPGAGHPSRYLERKEDFRDRREDIKDRREDFRDRREDFRDRREDIKDRREDIRDKREDIRDRREDFKDRREDFRDKREDYRDKAHHPGIPRDKFENKPQHKPDLPGHEFKKHQDMRPRENIQQQQQPRHDHGVRDHGAGIGAGKGQGGAQRAGGPGPRGGGRKR